jgi:hypothetical protein
LTNKKSEEKPRYGAESTVKQKSWKFTIGKNMLSPDMSLVWSYGIHKKSYPDYVV